jgi:RNA recognition motif-containing protein
MIIRGYCFINFETHALANQAYQCLNGKDINDRPLSLGWAIRAKTEIDPPL